MTLNIKYPDKNFAGAAIRRLDRVTSIRTNLVGEFQLGRDKETSAFNLADPDAPLGVWTGGTTFDDRAGNTNQTNWLNTGVEDNVDLTVIWAGQLGTVGSCNMVSNFPGSPNQDAIFLGLVSSSLNGFAANTDNTLTFSTVAGTYANTTNMGVCALRTSSGTGYTIKTDVFKAGVRLAGNSATATGKTRVKSSRTLGIGGIGGSYSQAQTMSVYGALVYHANLSDAELLAVVQDMTEIAAARTGDHTISL